MNLKDIGESLSSLWKKLVKGFNDDPRLPLLITAQILKTAFVALVMLQNDFVCMLRTDLPYIMLIKPISAIIVPAGIAIIISGLFDRLLARVLKLPILKKQWRYCNQSDCLAAINMQHVCQGDLTFLGFVIILLVLGFLLDYPQLKAQEEKEARETQLSQLR